MGGKGSGGARVGAGRKSKEAAARWLDGGADRRGPKAKRQQAEFPAVAPPDDLPVEQLAVWLAYAGHAREQRTLTPATAGAFRDLCEAMVLKRAMLAQIQEDGLTYQKVTVDGTGTEHVELKAHPLISQHRGMMQRVEAGMLRFRLAPIGKELVVEQKEADPFEEFEQETTH